MIKIGVDEVGRGAFAGPVVVCALAIKDGIVEGVMDSKMLTREKREELYKLLIEKSIFAIGCRSASMIDKMGIFNATQEAMWDAVYKLVNKLGTKDVEVLVDGKEKITFLDFKQKAIIKGDQKIYEISAASIIAKVFRDNIMFKMKKRYPEFSFDKHVGYGTKLHRDEIKKYGMIMELHRKRFIHFQCPVYRRKFIPLDLLNKE